MSKELDRILGMAIEANPAISEIVDKASLSEGGFSKEEIVNIIKENSSRVIYEEIKEEIYEDVLENVRKSHEKEISDNKISELKKLIISGVVMSGLVGLLVNQLTELIGYYKRPISEVGTGWTWTIAIVLALIIVVILLVWFIGSALKIIDNYNKKD